MPLLRILLFAIVLATFSLDLSAQEYFADNSTAYVPTEQVTKVYRLQKRLPAFYTGFAIEVATSDLPVQKSHPIYGKFGKIYYHKLKEGGYSYLIQTPFSDLKSVRKFYENVVKSKSNDARIIKYNKGKRKIKS